MAEALLLIQPWIQARTGLDCCSLCFQERNNKSHIDCKRAHLAAYNSIIGMVKLEQGQEFAKTLRALEEAKEKCLSSPQPNEECHAKSQEALKRTLETYERILEDYKKHLPERPPSSSRVKTPM